jgi:hypothetical protein
LKVEIRIDSNFEIQNLQLKQKRRNRRRVIRSRESEMRQGRLYNSKHLKKQAHRTAIYRRPAMTRRSALKSTAQAGGFRLRSGGRRFGFRLTFEIVRTPLRVEEELERSRLV